MKTTIHRAETRGHANHGWLNTYHTFSFANYRDDERIHFGALRVLNDDTVAAGEGFGIHPHQNMEIISIPLEGVLSHKDSHDHAGTISKGEVQIMSAGTGVFHSEMNGSEIDEVKFLQIWVIPDRMNVQPRYAQNKFDFDSKKNDFLTLVSPEGKADEMWIHQNAWFHWANFEKGKSNTYTMKSPGNGLYVFILEGEVKVGDIVLSKRDGMGIEDINEVSFEASTDAEFLIMEVPMMEF